MRAQFKDRKTVAMLMSTPGFVPDLEKASFPLAVMPPPMGELGKLVTNGAFGLYAVVNVDDADQQKAAHELAKYLTGSQVAKDVQGWQLAPGLRSSNTGYATNADPRGDRQAGRIRRLRSAGRRPRPSSAHNYGAALQAIILGKQTPRQAMDDDRARPIRQSWTR